MIPGFDPKWRDVPDYILGITADIWEGREIESLTRLYAPDLPMRFASGLVRGNRAVIDGTLATLAEFPDRELLGEDVIWCADAAGGYLSSHRLMTRGTHRGHGYFGPPTGRRYEARAIADCAVRDGVIYDEWLTRDSGAIVRQLGMEPEAFARALIDREGGPEHCARPFTTAMDADGGYAGRGDDDPWGVRLEEILTGIMDKDFAVIRRDYDRAARIEHPGGRGGWSYGAAETVWMQLRSSFPSARFTVEHRIGREDPQEPPRAAIRWGLQGRHDGPGLFGAPTGAEVYVMGFTHADFGPRGLRREYTLFDDVAIWKQIALATG